MKLEAILNTVSATSGPPRVLEVGKLKLGGLGEERTSRDGNKWRLPRKDDHFSITTLSRDDKGDLTVDTALMAELVKKYGDKDGKLRQVPIRLMSDEISDVLVARFVWYGKKTAGAVSDGETVTWKYDPQTMQPIDPPRVEDWKPEMLNMRDRANKPLFKLHSVFSAMIASTESRFGGVYKFRTTSIISFKQLYASLVHISQLTGGTLIGMPLMLVVRPLMVSPDGKPTKVQVVHVELRGRDLQEIQNIALEQAKFRLQFKQSIDSVQRQYQRLLMAPGDEPVEEASEIAAEFVPDDHDYDDAEYEKPEFTAPANIVNTRQQLNEMLSASVERRPAKTEPAPEPAPVLQTAPEPPVAEQPSAPEPVVEAPSVAPVESEPEHNAEGEPSEQDVAWAKLMGEIEAATDMEVAQKIADAYMDYWGVSTEENLMVNKKIEEARLRINGASTETSRESDLRITLETIAAADSRDVVAKVGKEFHSTYKPITKEEAKALNDASTAAWERLSRPLQPPSPPASEPQAPPKPKRRGPAPVPQLPGM